jgi:CHASE2 domain-containing sensor protein
VFRPCFLLTLVVLIVLSMLLSHIWAFEYAGVHSLEILQAAIPAVTAKYARIVSITPEDYREVFGELIDAAHLDLAIDRILEFDPALVVVDLDTSARRFRQLKQREKSKVIWARDADEEIKGHKLELSLRPVRGNMDSSGIYWGLALYPRSLDWTIRTYRRTYTVGTASKPALHWEAAIRFCDANGTRFMSACANVEAIARKEKDQAEPSGDELTVPILHARYAFEHWRLGDILTKTNAKASSNSDLARKIVLLGGSYSPQDRHQTPFAVLDGVEVVASAVEAELNPQGQREMGLGAEIVLKVFLALLIAVTHHFLRPSYALLATMGLLTFLIFFGSLVAAFFAAYRADFVPFLVGILIEQLYSSAV